MEREGKRVSAEGRSSCKRIRFKFKSVPALQSSRALKHIVYKMIAWASEIVRSVVVAPRVIRGVWGRQRLFAHFLAHLLELLLALDLELVPRLEPRFFELPVPLANWNFSARLPLLYPRLASSARASSSLTSLRRAAQPDDE